MKNILINPQVYDDLKEISEFIAEDSEENSKTIVSQILEKISILADFSDSGLFLNKIIHCDHRYRFIMCYSYAIISC